MTEVEGKLEEKVLSVGALLWSPGVQEAPEAAWQRTVAALPPTLLQVIGIVQEAAVEVQRWLDRAGVQVILRPQTLDEESQILRLGLQALKLKATAILFCPVGLTVAAATLAAILEAGTAKAGAIVRPVYQGQPGWPVFCPRELTADLYRRLPLAAIWHRYPERLNFVAVADAGVVQADPGEVARPDSQEARSGSAGC